MAKMQSVSFDSIEEMLEFLPDDQFEIVQAFREFMFTTIPDIKEKLSYNVPYYKLHKNICFIWPGAVPWGKVTFEGAILGFTKGFLLTDETNYLKSENRKYVTTRKLLSKQDLDYEILENLVNEAVFIDQEEYLTKLKGRKNDR
ncbi:MAG: DUF1801 domain-containing protein [Saprospiraceae bacterium]|nr:DUF1801 domain-containing protein [Saprospiraceae bacterium]